MSNVRSQFSAVGRRSWGAAAFVFLACSGTDETSSLREKNQYLAPPPYTSNEFGVDAPVATTNYFGNFFVSRGTDSYLVVGDIDVGPSDDDLAVARIGLDGTLLDEQLIIVSDADGSQRAGGVVFDGTNWLIVARDERAAAAPGYDVYGYRVAQDGTVLDPDGIRLSLGSTNIQPTGVAFDGTQYLVAMSNDEARFVSTDGIPSATTIALEEGGHLSFNGTDYLNAFTVNAGRDSVRGQLISTAGVAQPSFSIRTGHASNSSMSVQGVSTDGAGWMVAFTDNQTSDGVVPVSSEGVVGTRVNLATSVGLRVGFAGGSFTTLERGSGSYTIGADRVSSGGTITLSSARVNDIDGIGFNLSSGGSEHLLAYTSASNADLSGATAWYNLLRTDLMRGLENSVPFGHLGNAQSQVTSASNGSDYLVVYGDDRNKDGDIYGARVDGQGNILDPEGIAISLATGGQYHPVVGSNGTDYLVAWSDAREAINLRKIYGCRVTADGTAQDPIGLQIGGVSGHMESPAIASDGDGYLVVWAWGSNSSAARQIRGARVSSTGALVDLTPINIGTTAGSIEPDVAFDGTNYLVVWNQGSDIRGARVSTEGAVLDSTPLVISATVGDSETDPRVTSDGTGYYVVWQHASRARGARVSTDGLVLDITGVELFDTDVRYPNVVYDGSRYRVIAHQGETIHHATVETDGSENTEERGTIDFDDFGPSVSDSAFGSGVPRLSSRGGGESLLSYIRFDSDHDVFIERARVRYISDEPIEVNGGDGDGDSGTGGTMMGDGDAGDGDASSGGNAMGDGDSGDGDSGDGDSGDGDSGGTAMGDGDSGDGDSDPGNAGDGDAGDGDAGDGDSDSGMTGDGDSNAGDVGTTSDDGGCSCRTTSHGKSGSSGALLLLAGLLLAAQRRRRFETRALRRVTNSDN